ncbi:MKL/myocardin-like protein 2 [Liparis tanakae]|uniref:Phosphatase and actin regulator n=1 Tax=Liparis tanakae TaxID=230148 RepID=A0A4Z2IP27_9TELE|nr:MKL/myocardin-like protein 2 [Liparis tanakae]
MPPLKTPASFHERIRSLERARTQAEASLQATQMKLKRARLTDDLNEKIAQRPGAMELVEKNILPVDSGVEEDIDGGEENRSKPPDIFNFGEESSEALSPQRQPARKTSPRESGGTEATSTSTSSFLNSPIQRSPPPNSQSVSDVVVVVSASEPQSKQHTPTPRPIPCVVPSLPPGPLLVKQSLPRLPSDRSRGKKGKEPKPRVKKLKYHQYIPPDQKQELNDMLMDSAYARLLQQQQQFLQLQILNQQQQFSYQADKATTEGQTSCSRAVLSGSGTSGPLQPRHAHAHRRPDRLPANLDEMKTDLIERLKLYQENSNVQIAVVTGVSQSDHKRLTPPVSPMASKVSTPGTEDGNVSDGKLSEAVSPSRPAPCGTSPQRPPQEERPADTRSYEKDKRLHDKERQIEELMRKLEQEQRLVEELKMQLEAEKRSQQADPPAPLTPLAPVRVKEENGTSSSNGSASCGSPGVPPSVKQEEAAPQSRFIISDPTFKQHKTKAEAPNLRPASAVSTQLPASGLKLHTPVSSADPGFVLTSGQVPQKTEASAALQQCSPQTQTKVRKHASDTTLHLFL